MIHIQDEVEVLGFSLLVCHLQNVWNTPGKLKKWFSLAIHCKLQTFVGYYIEISITEYQPGTSSLSSQRILPACRYGLRVVIKDDLEQCNAITCSSNILIKTRISCWLINSTYRYTLLFGIDLFVDKVTHRQQINPPILIKGGGGCATIWFCHKFNTWFWCF